MKLLEMAKGTSSQQGQGSSIIGREADRITITALPSHMDYSQWRYGLTVNIMSASPQPQLIQIFIDEISNPAVSDAQLLSSRPPSLQSVDMKIFASVVQLLINKPSDDTARILSTIRMHCTSGCGRQAIRVLDGDYMHQGPKRRQVALEQLHQMRPVNELFQVEPTIVWLKGTLLELRGSAEVPSDAYVLGMLRTLFCDINKLSPVFTTYDLLPGMQPQYLLDTIMKTCVEYTSHNSIQNNAPSKAHANAASGAGRKSGGKGGGKRGKGDSKV